MAYVKTVWATGDIITATLASHWETQYDEAAADLNAHKTAATLDHPNSSVTDAKIGSRTADQTQTPTGNTGLLGQFISWFANRIKAITGKTNWYDAPDTTLAAAASHFNAADPHPQYALDSDLSGHATAVQAHGASGSYRLAKTSRSDQLPAWADIPDKPTSFTPSAHKSTHATGGSDALSPADIGAAPSGHTHTRSQITDFAHKSTHASGGSDALTPADIGAAPSSHTHSPSQISPQGAGSGLDADKVDGLHATAFARIATGSYTGNGASSRTITVGFTPKMVWLTRSAEAADQFLLGVGLHSANKLGAYYYVFEGSTYWIATTEDTRRPEITTNGFIVGYAGSTLDTNYSGYVYYWLAIG